MPPCRINFVLYSGACPPSTGTWSVSDVAFCNDGIAICTVAGTPGTWVVLSGTGGSGVTEFMDLDDVDNTGLGDGDVFAWDNGAGKLEPLDLSGVYAPIANGVTNGDSHDHAGGDGGTIAYGSLSGTPDPAPIYLGGKHDIVAVNGYYASIATTGFDLNSTDKFFEFQVPFSMLESHFGAGNWKLEIHIRVCGSHTTDLLRYRPYNSDAAAYMGAGNATAAITSTSMYEVVLTLDDTTWATNWPTANNSIAVAWAIDTATSGHSIRFNQCDVWAVKE